MGVLVAVVAWVQAKICEDMHMFIEVGYSLLL